jgi:translation initiation factor IF-2
VGRCYGKVKAMFNDYGFPAKEVTPSTPVKVLGLSGVPEAGEKFYCVEDEKKAREIVNIRQESEKQSQLKLVQRISLEQLYSQIKEGQIKELKIILKADVMGSLGAIKESLKKLHSEEIKINIIHEGIGSINTSDAVLAAASNALILGFNIMPDMGAKEVIAKEGIEVRTYNIIYELTNELKAALEGMLEPKIKKVFLGKAEVRKVFSLSTSGVVAGCFVSKGKILRNSEVNLVRNGQAVFEGKISSLKRFKDDVREVVEGFECGISLVNFQDIHEGDIIEAYEIQKIARKL